MFFESWFVGVGRAEHKMMCGERRVPCSSHAFQPLISSPLFTDELGEGSVPKGPFYLSRFEQEHEETGDDDVEVEECIHPLKKRRLSAEQVQFLERSFEAENKLEPERKIKLAKDLGLQPRQVAVWFQNRRARWKTKQLERDYDILKSQYENLRGDYDNLLKERDKLKAEVIFLTDKMRSQNEDGRTEIKRMETIDKKASPQPAFHSESGFEICVSVKNPPAICKYEDLASSATDSSGVLDEDSPRHIDSRYPSLVDHVNSSNTFEADQSDVSLAEEEEEEEEGIGLYPEASALSCNDMFAMDDQGQIPLWEWP